MLITTSIILYCISWGLLVHSVRQRHTTPPHALPIALGLALMAHATGTYMQVAVPEGYSLSFFKISSVFFWMANFLVLVSSLRKPLHNLFLVTLPVSVAALIGSLFTSNHTVTTAAQLTPGVAAHILLSVMAYSTMIVATVQALILAYQNARIRNKHPTGFVRILPPLETMETLLFELLWAGQLLLTVVIITGFFQIENLAAQHLYHKITFTIFGWVTYGVLLWGRHALGWRGNSAIRWTLTGSGFLLLAYLGTKLVLELILGIEVRAI